MTRRRKSQQRKEPETVSSATEQMDMDISKMSEIEFRIVIIKSIVRLEKSISDNIESLRAERRSNQAEGNNAVKEILSKLHTLTAGANEAEERTTDVEDKLIVRKERDEIGIGS